MHADSRYKAAVNAALRIVRLYSLAPPGADALAVSRITFLVLEALNDAERRLAEVEGYRTEQQSSN